MRTRFIFLFAFFLGTFANAQTKSVMAEIHFDMIVYKGDTLKLDPPKIFSVNKTGASEIDSIGKIKNTELAVQIEMWISSLGGIKRLVVGKVFYTRKGNDWEQYSGPSYHEESYNIIKNGKNNHAYQPGYGNASFGEDEFEISFRELYTIIQ